MITIRTNKVKIIEAKISAALGIIRVLSKNRTICNIF